uniref:Uncharacterized protein n=1 Tax=Anguilla anguilla TaxID=7936 RepID=A0A0E9TMT9_ANGAN
MPCSAIRRQTVFSPTPKKSCNVTDRQTS